MCGDPRRIEAKCGWYGDDMNKSQLERTANRIRKGIVSSIHSARAGHPGGSLSAADILTALYFHEMNIDPANPQAPERDRFVLSKGHAAPALYARWRSADTLTPRSLIACAKSVPFCRGTLI